MRRMNTSPLPQQDAPHLSEDEARESSYRDCLTAIARQDETALGALYDATLSKVYAVALRITGKPELAEEVVADVYLQVWREAANYDAQRGKAMTWLLTLCRSRALDTLRRRDKAESHPEPETLYLEPPCADDPQDLLLDFERGSAVRAALEILSPVQQRMVELAFFKDLSHQEIAEHTGLPLGSVKTHIRKALLILQQSLGLQHWQEGNA